MLSLLKSILKLFLFFLQWMLFIVKLGFSPDSMLPNTNDDQELTRSRDQVILTIEGVKISESWKMWLRLKSEKT
jgi:hypothetical protein